MQFLADGAWNKPFHTGYAAMNGLVAACMAREGFRGAREAIEGRAGFLHAYAPNADPALASEDLGERWETLRIAIKPYPSCRYSHAPMDALIALRGEHGIDWRDVESVEIGLSRTGWNLIGDPEDEKQRPETYVDGQFSMPFCAAVALRDGALTWDSYDTHLGDADTLGLCRRVRTAVDERVEADFPGMAGLARITTKRGGAYEQYVKTPRGEPENFLTREELKAKFDGLAAPVHGREPARRPGRGVVDHRRGRGRGGGPPHDPPGGDGRAVPGLGASVRPRSRRTGRRRPRRERSRLR